TSSRARRSNASGPSSTASCAPTSAPPTGRCAIPASTRSPRPNGPRCGPGCVSAWRGTASPRGRPDRTGGIATDFPNSTCQNPARGSWLVGMAKILILGGTQWLGRTIALQAVGDGHDVACLARGVSGGFPDGATAIVADREADGAYDGVATGHWDLVIELTCRPAHARAAV